MVKTLSRGKHAKAHLSPYERRTLGKLRIGIQKVIELIESSGGKQLNKHSDIIQAFYTLRLYYAQDPSIFHWHPEWFPEEVTTSLNIVNHILLEKENKSAFNIDFVKKIVGYATGHSFYWFKFEDVPSLNRFPLATARGQVKAKLDRIRRKKQNARFNELMTRAPRKRTYLVSDLNASGGEYIPISREELKTIKSLLEEVQSFRQNATVETSMLIDVRLKTIEEIISKSLNNDPTDLIENLRRIVGVQFKQTPQRPASKK